MVRMMDLDTILKGHEGETFYCPLYGDVVLTRVDDDDEYPIIVTSSFNTVIALTKDGKYYLGCEGECLLFPSKEQRDWSKWMAEQKLPKTWSEVKGYDKGISKAIEYLNTKSPIIKSCTALLMIHQLIEKGYGGNITRAEWDDEFIEVWYISKIGDRYIVTSSNSPFYLHLAFHTKEQVDEFLSYPENIQLLNQFYRYD